MAIHNINGTKIHTSFDYPPIPVRNMDWSAVTDNYDCDCDQDGFFSTHPVGRGATEQEAIADLIEQLEDCHAREPHRSFLRMHHRLHGRVLNRKVDDLTWALSQNLTCSCRQSAA